MIIVETSNIVGDCEFDTLESALNFVKDQIEMGFTCLVYDEDSKPNNEAIEIAFYKASQKKPVQHMTARITETRIRPPFEIDPDDL